MDLRKFDQAFLPFEAKLLAQEELRRRIGVREVDRPTYEKYITGPIERFDHRRNGFMASIPGNPFGEEMRERLKARGIEGGIPLPLPPSTNWSRRTALAIALTLPHGGFARNITPSRCLKRPPRAG